MNFLTQTQKDNAAIYLWKSESASGETLDSNALLFQKLQTYANRGACELHVMKCTDPCGGSYYRLDILNDRSAMLKAIADVGVTESAQARFAFIGR